MADNGSSRTSAGAGKQPKQAERAQVSSSAGEEIATGPEVVESDAVPLAGDQGAVGDAAVASNPDDDLRRKFREAMAAKHGDHGADKQGHGDKPQAGHGSKTGPTQRMFRRKAGG
ncbi:MAG: DUF5302 domain-containing protein [Candidatus Nanopelagicales bacterium]